MRLLKELQTDYDLKLGLDSETVEAEAEDTPELQLLKSRAQCLRYLMDDRLRKTKGNDPEKEQLLAIVRGDGYFREQIDDNNLWTLGSIKYTRETLMETARTSSAVAALHDQCTKALQNVTVVAKAVQADIAQFAANVQAEQKAKQEEEQALKRLVCTGLLR